MITAKRLDIFKIVKLSLSHIIWLIAGSSLITSLYFLKILTFSIPWVPVSVIGTAVAFFVGFKNNQAYDRMWEARKIWGGIVNSSRTWGIQVNGYISGLQNNKMEKNELQKIKQRLIYRHIAWLYTHRNQLLESKEWEHGTSNHSIDQSVTKFQNKLGLNLFTEEASSVKMSTYIDVKELDYLKQVNNKATQIINNQSCDLSDLREDNTLDDIRYYALMKTLGQFYELQGKNERIKNFPLPRQYANLSSYFTGIFLLLLPFTLIPELMSKGTFGVWWSIPIVTLIGWVYIMMELISEYTENPFEGLPNDIPMLSMCRSIEIDLREMLKETEIPNTINSKNNILM